MAVDPAKQSGAPRSRRLGPSGGPKRAKPKSEISASDKLATEVAASWLRDMRISSGLSQSQLMSRLGATGTLVSHVENARMRVPPRYYHEWGVALGIEPREFARIMIGFYTPFLYEPLFGERFSLPE